MESKHTAQELNVSNSENPKPVPLITSKQDDSSISLNFDSAADCSYKSDDISATNLTSSEHFSSDLSDQHLKPDADPFDSGLAFECGSEFPSEENIKRSESPVLRLCEKLQFHDIYTQDKDGDTFLHLAVVEARSDVIFPIIRIAPHPDFLGVTNDLYQTPLHLATLTGKPHIVRRLVVAGAVLDIQDHAGNIPLHIACRNGDLDCVQALLTPITESEIEEANCSYQLVIQENDLSYLLNMKNFEGFSCVHFAASGGWKKVLECLFSHNADFNEQEGKSGRTALHFAVENENFELVYLLLSKCNANPLVQNYAGQTSYNVAWSLCKRNPSKIRKTILELLKKYFEKWDSSSDFGSDSSSDESENIEALLQTFKEVIGRK